MTNPTSSTIFAVYARLNEAVDITNATNMRFQRHKKLHVFTRLMYNIQGDGLHTVSSQASVSSQVLLPPEYIGRNHANQSLV